MLSALTLCSGIRTFMRKCLCSSLRGSAKPLIMLQENNMIVYVDGQQASRDLCRPY